jgi:hypothetical protein
MIPLSTVVRVLRFPTFTLAWLIFLFLLQLSLGSGVFLEKVALVPAHWRGFSFFCVFFSPHWGSCLLSLWYMWIFMPKTIERSGAAFVLASSWALALGVLLLFATLHPKSVAPVLGLEAFAGVVLGLALRHDIWGQVNTLVLGPFWLRVYEVPSYVLLFFWMFYLLLSNLFLAQPFADAPMLYFLPLGGFLGGFLAESARMRVAEILTGSKQDPIEA